MTPGFRMLPGRILRWNVAPGQRNHGGRALGFAGVLAVVVGDGQSGHAATSNSRRHDTPAASISAAASSWRHAVCSTARA